MIATTVETALAPQQMASESFVVTLSYVYAGLLGVGGVVGEGASDWLPDLRIANATNTQCRVLDQTIGHVSRHGPG